MTTKNGKPFPGFPTVSFTPVPDVFFDELLPKLSNCELRVILYAIRRIYGWRKAEDWISLGQFISGQANRDGTVLDNGCGLSRQGVINGLREAVEHGYMVKRVVCGRCKNEIADRVTAIRTVGGPGKQQQRELEVVPKDCPFCQNPLQGSRALQQHYRLRLVNDVDYYQSTTLTTTSQRRRLVPVNDVDSQQTIQTITNNNKNVVVVQLSKIGVRQEDAESWAKLYPPARIFEVITASEVATENRPGWIRKALEEGWQFDTETDRRKSEQSERAAAIVASLQRDNGGGDHHD